MSAPPFTPGDWIADEKRLVVETADHKLDIAQVFDDGTCPADQLKADVHLLGASKAMYAALREAREWIIGEGSIVPERLVGRIGVAIAQAEGHR